MGRYRIPPKWHEEDDRILAGNWQKKSPIEIAELVFAARMRRAEDKHAQGSGARHCRKCGKIAVGSCKGGTVVLRAAFLGLVPLAGLDALAARWYKEHRKKDLASGLK